jgi:hypothetical protein
MKRSAGKGAARTDRITSVVLRVAEGGRIQKAMPTMGRLQTPLIQSRTRTRL